MTKTLNFSDKNDYAAHGNYVVPNEDSVLWGEIVSQLPNLENAAGICSAGEVGFFSMLPYVEKELVLVDHSYSSLAIAMTKYLLIRELGPEEAFNLLTGKSGSSDGSTLKLKVEEILPELPRKVRESIGALSNIFVQSYYVDPYANYSQTAWRVSPSIVEHWNRINLDVVKKFSKKSDKVKFVHGDLTDLIGPFDLLYLSNAFEHTDRNSKKPVAEKVLRCLSKDGHAIVAITSGESVTSQYGVTKFLLDAGLERKSSSRGKGSIGWAHTLFVKSERKKLPMKVVQKEISAAVRKSKVFAT